MCLYDASSFSTHTFSSRYCLSTPYDQIRLRLEIPLATCLLSTNAVIRKTTHATTKIATTACTTAKYAAERKPVKLIETIMPESKNSNDRWRSCTTPGIPTVCFCILPSHSRSLSNRRIVDNKAKYLQLTIERDKWVKRVEDRVEWEEYDRYYSTSSSEGSAES